LLPTVLRQETQALRGRWDFKQRRRRHPSTDFRRRLRRFHAPRAARRELAVAARENTCTLPESSFPVLSPSLSRGQNDAKSRAQMCTRIDRAHSFRFAAQY
jgi:hypothetical protein